MKVDVPEPGYAVARHGLVYDHQGRNMAVADRPTACVAGLHRSRIRVTSGAGNSVDVVRVRRDWYRSSHSARACQT